MVQGTYGKCQIKQNINYMSCGTKIYLMEYLIINSDIVTKKIGRYFMRYYYVIGIVIAVLLLLFLLVILRMSLAKHKVRRSTTDKKEKNLNKALSSFGFCYVPWDDTVSSHMYPWQREMGYCRAYDESAATMNMVFECEPVYFNYNGQRYLIEIWKGQYGCTTGAEIGVYVNRTGDYEKAAEDLFYDCVEDDERLELQFVLYKNGERILERRALHWWLTGFCVGLYSECSELVMEVGITFPNMGMRNAFCESLFQKGYNRNMVRIEQGRVYFWFDRPYSIQPDTCGEKCRRRVQKKNHRYCRLYNGFTKSFSANLDKINYIGYCFPLLYRVIILIGFKGNQKKWKKLRRKMG